MTGKEFAEALRRLADAHPDGLDDDGSRTQIMAFDPSAPPGDTFVVTGLRLDKEDDGSHTLWLELSR